MCTNVDSTVQDGWSRHDSQLGADRWVLEQLGGARFYVDVGANHGVIISNTYLLDKLGWRGICVEPVETEGYTERTCAVEREVLGSEAGKQVEFQRDSASSLSGVRAFLGPHGDAPGEIRNTSLLKTVLQRHNAPRHIDFMSLDTEGSEYEILKTFPFDLYTFGHIAIEHNGQEPKRSNIRKLLQKKGYVLQQEVQFDDWYVLTGCF